MQSKVGKVHLHEVIRRCLSSNFATHLFIKIFKRQCGISLKDFAKFWIYGTGACDFEVTINYNKRENAIDLTVKQKPLFEKFLKSPSNIEFEAIHDNKDYHIPLRINCVRYYEGPLNLIIHETDGSEQDSYHKTISIKGEVQYIQIKCKKTIRRASSSKRKDDNDEEKKSDSSVMWIRVDPDFEMIRRIRLV